MRFSNTFWRRAFVGGLLAAAFVVMASVFSPDRSQADETSMPSISDSGVIAIEAPPGSADAHAGFQSLGTIETAAYLVQIYSTQSGPRYSVYDRNSRVELGTLLNEEQVQTGFPEIMLPRTDFSMPVENGEFGSLMIAEPIDQGFSP
jgi:hypothetical protein